MRMDTARADRITAILLAAIGVIMLWAGWTMDRLEFRDIHPASIPGLLPMILGAVAMVCAVLLFVSAQDAPQAAPQGSWGAMALAALWSGVYAVLMVGALPYYVATTIYVAGFLMLFDREAPLLRRAITGAVFGIVTAGGIGVLFRYAFLIRLP